MDGAAKTSTKPLQLTSRQLELVHELSLVSTKFDLGRMFTGAMHTLHSKANPESLPQSAHSLRELMEKLEGAKGIPVTDPAIADGGGSLGQKTRDLHAQWIVAKRKSRCLNEEPPANEIDAALRKGLKAVNVFLDWFEKKPRFLAKKAHGVVKGLDPLATMLPQSVQEAQAQEWRGLKDYFVGVSHHTSTTTFAEMEATVMSLERYLHVRLAPVKAQNQSAIEDLIKEVEGL